MTRFYNAFVSTIGRKSVKLKLGVEIVEKCARYEEVGVELRQSVLNDL
jgi:hypothetical protein